MESPSSQQLRIKLEELLKQQSKTLDARLAGTVSDTEVLKYELRQEAIREIWQQLEESAST